MGLSDFWVARTLKRERSIFHYALLWIYFCPFVCLCLYFLFFSLSTVHTPNLSSVLWHLFLSFSQFPPQYVLLHKSLHVFYRLTFMYLKSKFSQIITTNTVTSWQPCQISPTFIVSHTRLVFSHPTLGAFRKPSLQQIILKTAPLHFIVDKGNWALFYLFF